MTLTPRTTAATLLAALAIAAAGPADAATPTKAPLAEPADTFRVGFGGGLLVGRGDEVLPFPTFDLKLEGRYRQLGVEIDFTMLATSHGFRETDGKDATSLFLLGLALRYELLPYSFVQPYVGVSTHLGLSEYQDTMGLVGFKAGVRLQWRTWALFLEGGVHLTTAPDTFNNGEELYAGFATLGVTFRP